MRTTTSIQSAPDVLGGTPVFTGTRVPAQALIEYLENGDSIDIFLEQYPTVNRIQVIEFLEFIKEKVPGMIA